MNTQLATTQNKAVIQCVNKAIADDFVRRYQLSTKNALENILRMGEAVNEIYQKVKSGELDKTDLEYFCISVHLDPKGSTFRKYKAIGENANRFRQVMQKLPATFSVLYEMATLDADDFDFFTKDLRLSKSTSLEEFRQIIRKTKTFNKNPHSLPSKQVMHKAALKVQAKMNHFEFTALSTIKESQLKEILSTLNRYKNNGWIHFIEPEILTSVDDSDDDMKYFQSLAEQDARDLRM